MEAYETYLKNTFQNLNTWDAWGELRVSFVMDAKAWHAAKKAKALGSLYGTDLGNYLSRLGRLKRYAVPVVDDKRRASNGLKQIRVTYYSP